jgi:hypothetical protein
MIKSNKIYMAYSKTISNKDHIKYHVILEVLINMIKR